MNKIEIMKKMLEQDGANASVWCLLATEYVSEDMHSEALQAYSQALKYGDEELKGKILFELSHMLDSLQPKSSLSAPEESGQAAEQMGCVELDDEEENEASDGRVIPLTILYGEKRTSFNQINEVPVPIDFSDVGGLEELKNVIRMKIVKPFINPGLFDKYKKKLGGGILLFGPPGCGKTFIAKATAGECRAKFIPVHITDILDPYLGVSAQNIQDIFANARAKRPAILFFDEIDTIGYNRAKLSSEYMRSIIDQLLSEIEGIDTSTDKLLLIGATNMPWDVDSAFRRPGRFDKSVFVPPPDEAARAAIFKLKLKDRPFGEIDYFYLAKATPLFSGADIEYAVETAAENVINEILSSGDERPILTKDLLDAVSSIKPSTVEWLRTVKNYVKYSNQAGLYDDVDQFISRHKRELG